MAFIDLDSKDIEPGIVYVSRRELLARVGISECTLTRHVREGTLNAFRFRHRTYFHPDAVAEYEKLYKAGLVNMGKNRRSKAVNGETGDLE